MKMKGGMAVNEKIAALKAENERLKGENESLEKVVSEMKRANARLKEDAEIGICLRETSDRDRERIDELTIENERLTSDMDDVIDRICSVIIDISEMAKYDTPFEDIAKDLFEIVELYGDDNAITDTLEQFAYETGISLNE